MPTGSHSERFAIACVPCVGAILVIALGGRGLRIHPSENRYRCDTTTSRRSGVEPLVHSDPPHSGINEGLPVLAAWPPSATNAAPVTNDARSEARNSNT